MTFSFGPHACIGWRFSLLEMKIFISTLLPHFNFAPVEGVNIGRYNAIVTRPYVRSRYVDGPALPLMVSHYQG
jgi:cytochrome P450